MKYFGNFGNLAHHQLHYLDKINHLKYEIYMQFKAMLQDILNLF